MLGRNKIAKKIGPLSAACHSTPQKILFATRLAFDNDGCRLGNDERREEKNNHVLKSQRCAARLRVMRLNERAPKS